MNCAPQPDPGVVISALPNGEMVLVHLDTRQYYSMNSTGALLWNLMAQAPSIDAMSQALYERFDVTPEAARQTVCEFVEDLKAHNLITIPESRTQTP